MARTTDRWMTREAYERLREELRTLRALPDDDPGTGADRGAGDVLPAPRYIHDPAVRQARVHTIERLLSEAVVDEAAPDDGIAAPGKVLTIRYDGEEEDEVFLLGVRDASVADRMTVYSPESPLGAALVGARQGERRTFTAPRGTVIGVTLLRAEPYRAAVVH
ncbi:MULTISPECIES: GreA/GreB family elongation factor [Nocardiopsis]|uniref:GreA/GreB family elongation factor n=1 Tax=Nocardiopsis akebiae TaxID=2831968 RepID=A0ABX8C5T2_9ACTN|nr:MULTISPECIES: GreA/GreB family elongation factor [Nocardiopsis]ASU56410.1 transcription elongation factor GreAB [Nocardiopsis dassonvillei]QUX28859.1 GreA/GreB family elongation factor [Nocardiopsis akebiae]WDZ91423.1 GreA/GreB family elongation factor [Nocardiopsis sp. HUAS JQ3]